MSNASRQSGITRQALIIGAVLWGAAMAASAWIGLLLREWQTQSHIRAIVVLFFIAALMAFPLTMLIAHWLGRNWAVERRFALALVGLLLSTIGLTAFIFAMQYRLYYAEWHDDHLSVRWMFELGFTTAAAMYQFAVMGMPLFLPFGLISLIIAALWFARRSD